MRLEQRASWICVPWVGKQYTLAVTPKVVFGKEKVKKSGVLVGLLVGEQSGA